MVKWNITMGNTVEEIRTKLKKNEDENLNFLCKIATDYKQTIFRSMLIY